MMGSSNNSLTLTVHRKKQCLLSETSTEFFGVKIKTKVKKRIGFAND